MADEKQSTELVTSLSTENGNAVSVTSAAGLMIAEDALLSDISQRFAKDEDLVWKLRPFRQGSFEIVLELVAAAAPLLADSPVLVAAFKALEEFMSLKCRLAGRKYSISGNNVIIVEGGEQITVSPVGITLLDPGSRGGKAAEAAFVGLAGDKLITGVKFYRAGQEEPFSQVERADFESFHVPDTLAETKVDPVRATVGIRRPSFAKDLVWDLVYEGKKIHARLEDEGFLARATSGPESFNHRDRLDVTLRITKERYSVTDLWLNRSYAIEKVWHHIKQPQQLELADPSELGSERTDPQM